MEDLWFLTRTVTFPETSLKQSARGCLMYPENMGFPLYITSLNYSLAPLQRKPSKTSVYTIVTFNSLTFSTVKDFSDEESLLTFSVPRYK